ncbi:hypothetical protein UFOVP1636_17 [uncultured Caudovirales phage]|uniref:Uncharacterized protein n=1 Tax=uncultured Caudovirales phage TaxID=2100421 RepID=A0A6J5SZH5_9CAUD|nr:hypothetical protein UFOVP1636_17 [uncultured Caudovirales phage]
MAYNTLDFGNISLTDPTHLSALTTADIASLSGIDTLTLTGLGAQGSAGGSNTYNFNQTNWPSITMAGGAGGSGTYANAGSSGMVFSTNGTYNQPWQNLTMTNNGHQSSLNVKGDAEFEGKVKVNGQDLGEFMEALSDRLAILVPDPEKLEKFAALKASYEHYKLLEALCSGDVPDLKP